MSTMQPEITATDRASWSCALPMNFETLYQEVKSNWYSGDVYGSCMSTWFAVTNELWFRDPALVPGEWSYTPAASLDPREDEDSLYDACRLAATDALVRLGELMHQLYNKLDAAGETY